MRPRFRPAPCLALALLLAGCSGPAEPADAGPAPAAAPATVVGTGEAEAELRTTMVPGGPSSTGNSVLGSVCATLELPPDAVLRAGQLEFTWTPASPLAERLRGSIADLERTYYVEGQGASPLVVPFDQADFRDKSRFIVYAYAADDGATVEQAVLLRVRATYDVSPDAAHVGLSLAACP